MKQSINDYLVSLHRQHGTLTPDVVVEDARRKDSPLHDLFEWDTKKAALAHWHDVARHLIRNVRVTIVNESRTLRAPYFVRDQSLPGNQQGYTTIDRVRGDADLARDTVADECSRALAAFRRASDVAAAVGVDQDIRELMDQTMALSDRVRTESA
jgi:hypothetical protein